jgi:Zn-dependent peptidase ImmA (M78 family)
LETFRGFALADPVAPFIAINNHDAKAAWSFTLLHELVHLWLGTTGISGSSAEAAIERFCNDIASEFLLPTTELTGLRVNNNTEHAAALDLITTFANERNVSRSMVAYKLLRANRIDNAKWRQIGAAFRNQWFNDQAARRQRDQVNEGGPNYYVVRRHRLGGALVRLVSRMMSDGSLTPSKAGKVLGVRPRNVQPLLNPKPANRARIAGPQRG